MHNLYDRLPGIWCEVNLASQYTYANQEYCNLVGVKEPCFLIGKTVADLPCDAAQCAHLFWLEDQRVKETKEEQQFLNIIRLANNEWKIIKLIKSPVFDDNGNLKAILFHITLPYDGSMQNFGIKMAKALEFQIPTLLEEQSRNLFNNSIDKLSKKEQECLFFLIQGKTYKEIADIQSVSQRTIIDHIERLKSKLHCSSRSELISRAIEVGYNYQIPASLLTSQISIIL